ncbi:MAG: YfjI family protein [Burkholderiaceae bacterium]
MSINKGALTLFEVPKPSEKHALELQPLRPLVPKLEEEPFPTGLLPRLIREAVEEVVAITQAPVAMVASCALAAAATAVQGHVNVARNKVLIGPVSLAVLILAASGERKTTVDNLFTQGLRQWEADVAKSIAHAKLRQKGLVEAWAAQEAGLKEALKHAARNHEQHAIDTLTQELTDHAVKRPPDLHVPKLRRQDDTPERLATALTEWPMAAIISSEAGLLFGAHGMSDQVVMRNLAQFNIFWDGGTVQRGRVGGGDLDVSGMRVTTCLQVQPEAFLDFYERAGKLARGMGFFARYLITQPDSTQGGRYYEEPTGGTPALDRFNRRLYDLLSASVSNVDADGQLHLRTLSLDTDAAAKKVWTGYFDSVEEELGKDREYYEVQDAASKSGENAARLWANFVVFQDDASNSYSHMVSATLVARWYLNAQLRFIRTTAIPQSIRRAQQLEEWACKQCIAAKTPFVTLRSISQYGPNSVRYPVSVRNEAIETLVDHGRATQEKLDKTDVLLVKMEVLYENGLWRPQDSNVSTQEA